MKISIVIPVYNVEAYIADCLQSVFAQTFQDPMECLLVDDCGTDRSMQIVQTMLADYHGPIEFHILHHEQNRGLSAARNTGMAAATGDYVYFLDSDDYITSDCIEQLVKPLSQSQFKYDVVVGNYDQLGEHQQPKRPLVREFIFRPSVFHSYLVWKWYTMAWNKLYRLGYIREKKLQFKEGMIHEDELWSFQVACTASTIYVIPVVTYVYRLRGDSIITGTSLQKKMDAMTVVLQEIWNYSCEIRLVHSPELYEKIQSLSINNLKMLRGDASLFREQYHRQRKIIRYGWRDVFLYKGLSVYRLMRDIHCLMPEWLGCRWLAFCLKNR